MIELIGRHGKDCKIYVDDPEEDVIQFLYKVLDNDISQDIPIRVMPDCHSGTGCIVGLTLPTETKVKPAVVTPEIIKETPVTEIKSEEQKKDEQGIIVPVEYKSKNSFKYVYTPNRF